MEDRDIKEKTYLLPLVVWREGSAAMQTTRNICEVCSDPVKAWKCQLLFKNFKGGNCDLEICYIIHNNYLSILIPSLLTHCL